MFRREYNKLSDKQNSVFMYVSIYLSIDLYQISLFGISNSLSMTLSISLSIYLNIGVFGSVLDGLL
jgi:hypothetical protein